MKLGYFFQTIFVLVVFSAFTISAQEAGTTIISFDGMAGDWAIGAAAPENIPQLSDDFEDFVEGDGSMLVHVDISVIGASWGTWTDIGYTFPEKLDLTGATDLRMKLKIVNQTAGNRTLQFTCDLFDQPEGAAGEELFRWMEDLDIFYNFHANPGEWFEVVIPISRMATPGWAGSQNGVLDVSDITRFAFGIHSDSTGTDVIDVLFDDLRVTSTENVTGTVLSFDDNSAWGLDLEDPENNSIEVSDNFEDFVEGDGSMEVRVDLQAFPNSWGTWTDAKYVFPELVDFTGATEVRFWLKIVDPAKRGSRSDDTKASTNAQFTFDIFDFPDGATGTELWRYLPAGGGVYGFLQSANKHVDGWNEVAIPFKDFDQPGWLAPVDDVFDLNAIHSIGFGIHGDNALCVADTVIILMDNLYATAAGDLVTAIGDDFNPLTDFTFKLDANYPNPFNPSTTIAFELPENGNVSLKIYNVNGELVHTVVDNAFKIRGNYKYNVDMSNLSSGVYLYTLQQNNNMQTKKMTLLK
jgi:hypothetical protein